jgi:CDP-glucose 4,6-dehydratase
MTPQPNGFGGWTGRRVLVTGATGIVGSWVVKALLERGVEVIALVLDIDPRCEFARSGDVNRVTMVYGSLEDYQVVDRAVGVWEVDTVFHLAAQSLVGAAVRSPVSTFEANIRGTYHVLESCRMHAEAIRAVVVASSDKVYGSSPTLPYTEETALRAAHPYDVSKACADLIAQSYYHTYKLPVAITRCGNIYGGGDLNWSRIVPGTIRSLLRDERPVIRSDGKYVRDYLYVRDAASAYLRLAEGVGDGIAGRVFNFSGNAKHNVLDLVQAIQLLMGTSLEPDVRNTARAEIREQWLSFERASEDLGWVPGYTLGEGLRETIDWYRGWAERWER